MNQDSLRAWESLNIRELKKCIFNGRKVIEFKDIAQFISLLTRNRFYLVVIMFDRVLLKTACLGFENSLKVT